jgi:hypothetical protein
MGIVDMSYPHQKRSMEKCLWAQRAKDLYIAPCVGKGVWRWPRMTGKGIILAAMCCQDAIAFFKAKAGSINLLAMQKAAEEYAATYPGGESALVADLVSKKWKEVA